MSQPLAGLTKREIAIICVVIGVLVLLYVFAPWGRGTDSRAARPAPTSSFGNLLVGQEGHLDNGGAMAFVALDDAAYDALNKAAGVDDQAGIRELVSAGRVFLTPQHTAIRVLENSVFSVKVRILDGAQKDKAGWVPAEFVKQ
jgi:hypothetical protein